jgi:hypothetical protein
LAKSGTDLVTAVQLKELIARASSPHEALRVIQGVSEAPDGVLRVIAGKLSGRLALTGGRKVDGALVTGTGEPGLPALQKLLSVKTAVLQFLEMPAAESALHQQDLGIPLKAALEEAVAPEIPTAAADDPILEVINSTRSLTHAQIELLNVYRQLATEQDRILFLEENPDFQRAMKDNSLSQEQLELLALYSKLHTHEDKMDFLHTNTEFTAIMSATNMSDEHRAQFEAARNAAVDATISAFMNFQGASEKVSEDQMVILRGMYKDLASQQERETFLAKHPGFAEAMSGNWTSDELVYDLRKARLAAAEKELNAFLKFQQELLGDERRPLNDAQIEMLRNMYLDLADEANRKSFLEENPVLSEDLPVLRGDDVKIYIEPEEEEEGPDLEAEMRAKLDALKISAQDQEIGYEFDEVDGKKFIHRTGILRGKTRRQQIETGLSWAAAAILVGCFAFLGYAHTNRNAAPAPLFVEEGELDGELLSTQIDNTLADAVPSVMQQIASGGAGYGSAPNYGHGSEFYDTSHMEAQQQARMRMLEGDRLLSEGKTEQAIAVYLDCIQSNPDFIPCRVALIKAFIGSKQRHKAREACIAALKRARTKAQKDEIQALFMSVMSDPDSFPAVEGK